jgi:uncharacterized protein YqjF (DUF2071 family)
VITQRWRDVLFLHWPVKPEALRPLVPPELELDLYDRRAWLGVVPFRMTHIRLRGLPPLPGTAAFLELNVRTYVRKGGRGGVYFLSLDAANGLAVAVARRWFGLPYYRARMSFRREGEWFRYASRRTHRGAPPAEFRGRYRPTGPVARARPGELEHFLVERYALFAVRRGRVVRGDVAHEPWPLQRAEAEVETNTMSPVALAGDPLPHFAREVRARIARPVPM